MNCPACGFENPDGMKFCGSCAGALRAASTCPACGFENPGGFRFCGECAEPLETGRQGDRPARDPRDYTPKHLADKILQSKSALEGERKRVTVLFADVKSSMELSEPLDPEEWHRVLDGFFRILTEGVHRFEGTVNQYTGDGIMALFGAPIAHEDHAQRACYTALQLRDEVARYATEVKRQHGLTFSTRMGLHSGEVVVGKIGDDLRMDYTAQGHAVGLAQRMETLASPDTCYLSEATAALVSGYFELEDLGEFTVKGVREPVRVQRLVGVGEARTRFDVSRARGLTRFVGRDADMRVLEDALEQARAGNGQVVGIVAEAGTGKSRLCFEFVEACRARGLGVFEGQAVSHGKNIPLLPILQVFRAYFGISEHDDARTARERIAGRMLLLDESFREVLPIVFDFFGVPDPERPAPAGDPEVRQRQLFAVLHEMAQKGQDETPNITLIEDLHWIDAGSEAFLEQLVAAVEGTRFLLLVNFRPEYHADWMQRSWYRQLPIAPLGPAAIRELLDDLLGRDPSVGGLAERIHERTGGNPFFTEEVVLGLIESGALEGTRGAHRLVTPVKELAIPASVHTLLASRIDRLGEREKRVLQTASVIGKTFAEPLLAAVADVPANELAEALARLKSAEFVHEESLYPVARYAFKHPLTQAVAQDSLLRERRRELHGRVGRALEAASQESLDEAAALLAHHFEEADEAWEAARWHDRAAGWVSKTDVAEALRHWERTLALLEGVADSDEAARLGVDARTGALQVAWRAGMPAEHSDRLFDEGLELVGRLGDSRLEALLRLPHAICVAGRGEERRYEHSGRALEIARKLGSRELEVISLVVYCSSLLELGRVTEALDALDTLVENPPDDLAIGSDYWGFQAFGFLVGLRGVFLGMAGRMDEGRRAAARAIELARDWGTTESIILTENDASHCAALAGDAARALAHARRAVEVAERFGAITYISVGLGALAWAEILSKNWPAAASALERAREGMERIGGTTLSLLPLEVEAALGAGDLDLARCLAEEAFERSAVSLPTSAWVKTLQACIGVRAGELRGPLEVLLDEAATLFVESGAPAYAPHIHEVRAELLAREGDAKGAERERREALRRYKEMGATGHAARLARELGS